MSFDSAWIFRICLVMAVTLILFADFLGYGGANARKNDNTEDYEDYTAEEHRPKMKSDKGDFVVAELYDLLCLMFVQSCCWMLRRFF